MHPKVAVAYRLGDPDFLRNPARMRVSLHQTGNMGLATTDMMARNAQRRVALFVGDVDGSGGVALLRGSAGSP
jgi:hypothetical protein